MLHTVGYERRDLDELVTLLARHDVEMLLDVRGTPRSRKPGLSKSALADALEGAGIAYRHEPELGVPREERDAFRAGEPAPIERYRRRLDGEARDALERVVSAARSHTTALLCYERDEAVCHRRLVAEAAVELDGNLDHRPLP